MPQLKTIVSFQVRNKWFILNEVFASVVASIIVAASIAPSPNLQTSAKHQVSRVDSTRPEVTGRSSCSAFKTFAQFDDQRHHKVVHFHLP